MKIAWHGTASIAVMTDNSKILFDPFIPMKGNRTPTNKDTYDGFENIVITHAHFDHIGSIQELAKKQKRVIYGTKAVAEALCRLKCNNGKKSSEEKDYYKMKVIGAGSIIRFGDISVTAYPSRHVSFDRHLIMTTFVNIRILRYFGNLLKIAWLCTVCREKNEILGYLVEDGEKKVFILGSLNLCKDVDYPQEVDLLVLPYQGKSRLVETAVEVVDRFRPKAVMLNHFDDTFPPISKNVELEEVCRILNEKTTVIRPEYGKNTEVY